jgi:VCBS repeat-containing protein
MSARAYWLVLSVSLLAACGGGGEDAPPPAQQPGSAPVAVDDAAATVVGQAVTIPVLANDTDPDGAADIDPATVLVSGVTHGTTAVNAGNGDVTFTPDSGFTGSATFSYVVSDRSGNRSQPARVTVTVTGPGSASPTISDIADRSIPEDGTTGQISFTVDDADTPPGALSVSGTSSDHAVVPQSGIKFGGGGANRTVTVVPAPNAHGSATITVTVTDGAHTASDSFVLTVTPVNDLPTISGVADQTVAEDTDSPTLNVTVGDAETAADALTLSVASNNETLLPASAVTLGGSGADRTVAFRPAADQTGEATLTLSVDDGQGGTANTSFQVTVTPVNDAPVAQAASVSGNEGETLSGTLTATDVDSTALTFRAATQPEHGTLTVAADGDFDYVPAINFAGADSFTFVANDGALDSAPATVSITVNDVAEPTLSVGDASGDEDDGALEFEIALSRAPDAPVTVHYATADGTAGSADYTATSGDLQFTPDGETSFTVSVPITDDAFDESDESFSLVLTVTAGAEGVEPGKLVALGTIRDDDTSNLLRIGAAKRSVKPTQAHIDGVTETRIGGTERTQKFNLGGFGINPTQSLPNPADMAGEELTQPADSAAFSGSRGEEPIHIRAMVMEQPDGETVMFVMLDAIGAGNIIQAGVKAAITAVTGIPPENILFGQTHSHAGPDLQGLWGGVPEDWITNTLYQAAADVALEAFESRRAARLTLAQGNNVAFNNYRRPRIDPHADADGTLTLLKAVADDGTPVGTILQYNAHPTSINESSRAVHADYIQGAMDWVEEKAGGVGLYYNGPIADASGSGERANCAKVASDGKYGDVRCRGEGIADAALALTERELAPTLVADEREVILPITNPGFLAFGALGSFNRYYNFMQQVPTEDVFGDEAKNLPQLTPTATTLVSRITIGGAEGGLEIVTIPGEATNTFGQYIRGLAKTNVMLLGLTHNSFGYIVPEEEFSYVDQEGGDGLVAPFTGYEENVSLGPLTAPMLRSQGYNPLFAADPAKDIPPALLDCFSNTESAACIVQVLENRLDVLVADVSVCVENGLAADGCPLRTALEMTVGAIADGCREFGGPEEFCAVFDAVTGTGTGELIPDLDMVLVHDAALAQTAGCDPLDPANCLYPFPNDWFTAPAAPNSIQSPERGGTGRRVNIHPAATPRNSAGKPVDPTEWNRSDGFSPGALVTTFVPGLSLEQTFGLPSHELGVANVALSQADDAPILVLEVQDDGSAPIRHLVWSEIDQNANQLTIVGAPNVGTSEVPGATNEYGHVQRPLDDGRAALLIRPAKNFAEGKRYVVVLRNLKDRYGNAIRPQAGFRACISGGSTLPPIQARCGQLAEDVMPVLDDAGIALDEVFLAWDFTVESTESAIGRLRHMRDDAFATLSANPVAEDCTQLTAANAATCAAPGIAITGVTENPQGGIKRRIQGTITVPNYLAPIGPSPLDDPNIHSALNQFCASAPEGEFADGCADLRDAADLGQGLALPSRLFYSPADGTPTPDQNNALDPTGLRYGDGLPDRNGTMTARFLCQIPAQATPDNPARASLYGHGQLDRATAITYEGTPDVAREHNYMFCAVDWFGFRTGDAANVLSSLVDLSNFPVVPDASQQGMLNFMFLARAMQHPQGFGALPEFQDPASGRPVFDRSEIFYNGNSQGGIFGGVVLAASKDVNRGVLGSLGMNYSTLLTRSKNFDEYAGVLYTSYTDPLDRQLLFSMMQMLWDRSENNGYASHLVDNSAFGGPTNVVKLDPMFGDPQVTMYSAEVMARTMGVPFDDRQTLHVETLGTQYLGVNGRRHPAVEPYVGLDLLEYGSDAAKGSALVVWDTNHAGDYQPIPPVENKPPRPHVDNHDASQKARYGRCHMAHFLRTDGELIDIRPQQFFGAPCPAVPAAQPTTQPGEEPAGGVLEQIVAAINAVLAPAQQAAADLMVAIAGELGGITGIALDPPGPGAAPELPEPKPLLAGVAKRALQVPVGTPLGGYLRPPVGGEYIGDDPQGELTDNVPAQADGCDPTAPQSCPPLAPLPDEARTAHSPYATASPPSRGYYDSLIAKAVALYDGHDYVVMVKTDFIGMIDEVVQDVKAEVKARNGIDLGDGLIMSATHSHDGPGALANHSTRYFWLAMDAYQHDVYRRLVGQLADVVVAALADLRPARIGHGNGLESPNVGNGINGYRRGRLASYADDDKPGCEFVPAAQCPAGINDADELRKRIGILRVDDAATGAPLAVVINFADHGIAFDVENQYFSGDVLGAIEREVEQSYVKPAGDDDFRGPIAMLVQNTGGDVTPKNVEYSIRGIETLGKRMAPQVRAVADAIDNFQGQPDLRTVSQRVILNRERLGYAEGEYPYAWGAAQCGNDLAVPFADVGVNDIPGYGDTGLPRKHLYCIPATPPDAADLADNGVAENGAFVPGDTILTAARIGDITLLVQPGEPLTEYGVRALEMAQAEGFAPADTFVWGYAADHIGYILPPVEEDWATFGGAESTTTFWGWKQGQRFIDGHRELLRALRDGKAPPADEFQVNYDLYQPMYDGIPAAVPTPSAFPGEVVTQPANIKRFEKTQFVFEGGDPVVDLPHVTMLNGDGTPVRRANGEIIDTFYEMHLKYRLVSGRHLWTVEFEAPKDWAAGTYRFKVAGKANQGVDAPYELESGNFAVAVATSLRAQDMACVDGRCSVRVTYTPVPMNYRIVDAHVSPGDAAPMRTGAVTFSNGTQTLVVAADGSGNFAATIGGTVTATAVDAWGNTAPAVTAGGPVPVDADGDGVPDTADECPNEAGPASNNGCPEEAAEGFPVRFDEVCDPFGVGCLSDLDAVGVQGALDTAWNALMGGGAEPPPTDGVTQIATDAAQNAGTLPPDLLASAAQTVDNATAGELVKRDVEVVVMEGRSFPDWSQPPAAGVAKPYPSGVRPEGGGIDPFSSMAPYACDFASNDPTGAFHCGARDAHNGYILYPPTWEMDRTPFSVPTAVPVGEIVAFKRENSAWVEIPVQVDERLPYFLANAGSTFSTYSGTDPEVSYVWDRELWKATGECSIDPLSVVATPDPIANLDDDDEIAFMASDAGEPASPIVPAPEGTVGPGQEIALSDPLNPGAPRFVYLFRRPGGPSFGAGHYVEYVRDANADQFVDQTFWAESDPEKIGTENEGYGPNVAGTVCGDNVRTAADEGTAARASSDRFPRDGVTIRSDKYQVYASGRWMIRDVRIAKPGQPGTYGPDIVDRWKGRAFQQSPGSIIDIVGFEDEQVNWEANAALLGERVGPVRAIREVWGADSGTNVTKTETYYRDAYVYRYRVRVHPIPPDGLYTSWDYNRSAMVSDDPAVPGGRYYTAVRGTGVPIDGVNDDVTQIDHVPPVNGMCVTAKGPRDASEYGGTCPLYFDMADPALNLPLAIYNWEQVSAKGDLGSLVYLFELKNANGAPNAVAVPYYRDDACFDDATGDDPVPRPWPGETSLDSRVRDGYVAAAGGTPYEQLRCDQKQGAHAQHGLHFFAPPESDNAFAPVTVNELDGQQWAFPVSTERPQNVGEPYANVVRAPLVRTVRPRPSVSDVAGDGTVPYDYASCVAMAQQGGDAQQEAATKFSCAVIFGGGRTEGEGAEDEIQGPNTYVAMSDGTLIATNVYIPWACNVAKNPNARKCPSLLEMSGYESGSDEGATPSGDVDNILNPDPESDQLPLTGGTRASHDKFYRAGDRYVSVVASVRGTGCSAGEFDLFSRKSAYDGHQLVEWMAQQHWSNGKVGIFGHSYSGITGAMIASTNPPHLEMVSISGQIGDVYRDITYPGGVSNYGFPLLWTGGVRPAYDYLGGTFAGLISDSQDRQCLRNQAERSRTVVDEPLIQGLTDTDSPWFQERSVVYFLQHVTAPTQIVTAYQDEQTGPRGGTHVFDKLPQTLTRRLVVLNGDHGSQTGPAEVVAERKYWIDHILLGANDPAPRAWAPGSSLPAPDILDADGKFRDDGKATSRVLLELTSDTSNRSNGHIDSTGFPLAQTQWTDYYFQVDGTLDTARSSIAHGETGSGSTWFNGSKRQFYSYQAGTGTGAELSTADAGGADELIFALDVSTAAPGAPAMVIAGPITADLWITSTGIDTELMVQLIDADPATGERLYLQRGVLRASHREILAERSQCAAFPAGGRITDRACTDLDNIYRPFRPHVNPQDIVPGQATRYRLEIFPVGHVLRAGHQLLVKVHAPSLDDNDWAYISKAPPALNTLHHSAEYASSIRLPLIPLNAVSRLGGPTGTCTDDSMRCVVAGSVQDPTADYRGECWSFGEEYDPSGGVFTELVCGTFDAIASNVFGGGGSEPGPGSAIGEQTGTVLDASAEAYQGLLGTAESNGRVQAGVGVVDMTPDVGYGAGQYSPENTAAAGAATGGDVDPYVGGKKQEPAYGVQSRLTGRALVIEGANGKRIALLKSDNYLAQDHLVRRIGQILADKGSSIGYDQILYGVTHAHSSTYLSSPSAGVWVFQDAFDARFFEFQARKLADAILLAEANLQPARMGATTVHHRIYKGNVVRPHRADDNTPAGYPREFGDHGLVVMRFDTDEAQPKPLAVWINWGQHPEGLDGYSLHSPDYVGPLERFVDRELGAPLIFSQGDVGSAENSGNTSQRIRDDGTICAGPGATPGGCPAGQGVQRDWQHAGHAQGERGARFLADAIVKGWKVIGGEQSPDGPISGPKPNNYVASVQVPMSNSFPVDYRNAWVPGPLSHPYPGVSACRTETTAEGNPGVPNAADCAHPVDGNPDSEAAMYWQTLKAHGIPVPENYDLPAFGTVEENLRLRLQAFRVGDVVLGSSASEAQVDLILNFESRANDVEGDIYDGFDWACLMDGFKDDPKYAAACALQKQYFDPAEFHWDLALHSGATSRDPAAIARMRAQVHNAADGWDAPEYVAYANGEPADITQIKGNFTKEELPAERGYKLAVGIGHAGDYNGYTVSYREYMAYDDYRKALTAYGAHTADYMVTRMVRMAGAMKGGPELAPEPHDTMAQADEARQLAASTALGRVTAAAYESFLAALPPDVGPAEVLTQPRGIGWFEAATFSWRGGSSAVDNPRVVIERCDGGTGPECAGGAWQLFGDQHGEVQTRVQPPQGAEGFAATYGGQQEWLWTANFEAFDGFPARLGGTPAGVYRFVVEGCINDFSAPDASFTSRITGFLSGMLPDALASQAFGPAACRSGGTPYGFASTGFEVEQGADRVESFVSDGNGNLTIGVAGRSIPQTYESDFRFINAGDDFGSYCKECSFRPWAYSTAAPMSVALVVDGVTYPVAGSGTTWTAAVGAEGGRSASITVTYADGRVSRPFRVTLSGEPQTIGSVDAPLPPPEEPASDAPQLCAPDEVPEPIGGECAADNGGEDVQEPVNTVWGAVTGGL